MRSPKDLDMIQLPRIVLLQTVQWSRFNRSPTTHLPTRSTQALKITSATELRWSGRLRPVRLRPTR